MQGDNCVRILYRKRETVGDDLLCVASHCKAGLERAQRCLRKKHVPGQGSSPLVTVWIMVITKMDRRVLEACDTLIIFFPLR